MRQLHRGDRRRQIAQPLAVRFPPGETGRSTLHGRDPDVTPRVLEQSKHLRGNQSVGDGIHGAWPRGLEIEQAVGCRKAIQPSLRADPPLAGTTLQGDVLHGPAGHAGRDGAGNERVEAGAIETPEPALESGPREWVDLQIIQAVSMAASHEVALAAQQTRSVFEDGIDCLHAARSPEGAEAAVRQLHCAGRRRSEPQIAADVLVEGGDDERLHVIDSGEGTKAIAIIRRRKDLDHSIGGGRQQPAIGRFKQLKHPLGGRTDRLPVRASPVDERAFDDWRTPCRIRREPEDATEARRAPQLPRMIFEQILNVGIRQAIAIRVTRGMAVRPAAVQSARRGDPQRALRIFDDIGNGAVLVRPLRQVNLNGTQRSAVPGDVHPEQAIVRPGPDSAVRAFEQHGDRSGPWVVVVLPDESEHAGGADGRGLMSVLSIRLAVRIEVDQTVTGGDEVCAVARFEQVVHRRVWQPLRHPERRHRIAVEA